MKENIDTDDVLKGLEADRSAGTLEKLVSRSEVRYGVDPDDPERLVSIDKEGRTQQLPKSGLSRFEGGVMDDNEKAKLDNFLSPTDFISSLPCSIQKRLYEFSEGRQETGKELTDILREEARALGMYDAIYADVDAAYDLPNPILSRTIRGCVEQAGHVPDGVDRNTLLRECPQILVAIESAYQKHVRATQPTKNPTP